MTTNRNIEFKLTVDQASVQKAKQALTDLISLADRLGKSLAGQAGGPRHGNQPPMSFLSGIGATAGRPGSPGASNPAAGISSVITAQARGIKELSKLSTDSLRNMAGDLRKSVDDQKRSLRELDQALETAGKRFIDLKSRQSQLVSSLVAQGASPEQARAYAGNQIQDQEDYVANLRHKRNQARSGYEEAVHKSRAFYDEGDPYVPGVGKRSLWQGFKEGMQRQFGVTTMTPQGTYLRPMVVGAAVAGGVVAGANELQAQRFDYISNEARQAQAWKTAAVATKNGDLTYAAAMNMVLRDPDKAKEFLGLSDSLGEIRAKGVVGGVTGVLGGNPNIPGEMLRNWNEAPTVLKEKMRQYMEQQIQADPEFFDKLNKFQSEAGMRVHEMRRLGMSSGSLSKVRAGFGEDIGSEISAFEAVRAGGFGFAKGNMWKTLSAQRGGLNPGDVGAALAAQAPAGGIDQLVKTLRVTLDPVASEHLARGIASGINASVYGVVSGLGLGEALRFGTEGMSSEMQTRTMARRAAALPNIGQALGGGDPMGKAISLLNAARIVGPGGDIFTQNALAEVMGDPAAVAAAFKGQVSPELQAAGISSEMIVEMVRGKGWDTRARNIRQAPGTRLSSSSRAYDRLSSEFGGNIKEMFAATPASGREQLLTELSTAYHLRQGQDFPTTDLARSYVATLAGFGSPPVEGEFKTRDPAWKSAELDYARKAAKDNEENYQKWVTAQKDELKNMTALTQVTGRVFENMGKLDKSAADAAESIKALKDAADEFTKKYGTIREKDAKTVEKRAQELGAQVGHGKVVADEKKKDEDFSKNWQQARQGGGV